MQLNLILTFRSLSIISYSMPNTVREGLINIISGRMTGSLLPTMKFKYTCALVMSESDLCLTVCVYVAYLRKQVKGHLRVDLALFRLTTQKNERSVTVRHMAFPQLVRLIA